MQHGWATFFDISLEITAARHPMFKMPFSSLFPHDSVMIDLEERGKANGVESYKKNERVQATESSSGSAAARRIANVALTYVSKVNILTQFFFLATDL